MNKKVKQLASLLGLFIFTASLSACGSKQIDNKTKQGADKQASNLNTKSNQKILSIDHKKCIGCGKCARIAPSNFSLDNSISQAVIISQQDLNNPLIQTALKICPVGAINL